MLTISLVPYALISTSLAAWVVLLAFQQRSNFFSAAVYLSKSNACMLILWNFGIFIALMMGKLVQKLFFGSLRLIELERLHERVWYAVTESLLALTIFRDEFDTAFVIRFVALLFIKVFHWLSSDRVESMEQSPHISRLFHFRMTTMLSALWIADILFTALALESILLEGPSVLILFASEYLILAATNWNTTARYIINTIDLQSDVPWEGKSLLIFYVDLFSDFLKLTVYTVFLALILTFYGLPINVLRDVYLTARSFIKKCGDLRRYLQATKNMEARYSTATQTEMAELSDKTCIICREEMQIHDESAEERATREAAANGQRRGFFARLRPQRQLPNDTPKKLPCGHIFHFHCLKSWLERQQSCPTCRRSVLQNAPSAAAPAAAAQPNPVPNQANGTVPPAPQPSQGPAVPPRPRPSSRQSSSRNVRTSISSAASIPTSAAPADNPFVRFQLPSNYPGSSIARSQSLNSKVVDDSLMWRRVVVAPELGVPEKLLGVGSSSLSTESTAQDLPAISVANSSDTAEGPVLIPVSQIRPRASGDGQEASTHHQLHEQVKALEATAKHLDSCVAEIKIMVSQLQAQREQQGQEADSSGL